jgi:DNA polymerase-4
MISYRPRSIVHLNVADFAVAVERMTESSLKNRPVAVVPQGAARASVYDMSEEAYRMGVRKGMALGRARRLCPDISVVSLKRDRYQKAMGAFLKKTRRYSPLIESGQDDGHLFLDLTGSARLFGHPADVAHKLRKEVRKDLGFDPVWSVAANKLVAKAASRIVKPDGEYVVKPGDEESFLKPLSIVLLPGLERDDLTLLKEFNISKVGQAARWSLGHLNVVFGRRGLSLYRAVRGLDDSAVLSVDEKKPVVTMEKRFGNDTNDARVIDSALYKLVEEAGYELRSRNLAAGRIVVRLDYTDGIQVFRQRAVKPASALDFRLYKLARFALETAWSRRARIRNICLVCDRLTFPVAQLELFAEKSEQLEKEENLIVALDRIRTRFGMDAVMTGRNLGV